MARINPDLSGLPDDLLFFIVKLLPTRIDILRFRAVCRSFRATIPLPPEQYPFPHSILTSTNFLKGLNPDGKDLFDLTVSSVYAIEPLNKTSNTHEEETPQTWVVRVQERNPGRVVIIDPISGSECKNLSDQLPKSLNLLDYRVSEITKSYQLVSTDEQLIVAKLIFSSSLDENDDEFTVIARDTDCKELVIWRNLDKKWSKIDMEHKFPEFFIEDIIYHDDEYHMALFKLNEENQKWVPAVDGLELVDRVLFVGESRCAYSSLIKEVAGCVYYAGYSSIVNYPGQDTWICDCNDDVVGDLSVFPGYLNLFWPPPAWLKQELTVSAGEKQRRGSKDDCEETSQA